MRTLGPGSVSSFLKVILDVVYAALWIASGAVALALLGVLLFSFNPAFLTSITNLSDGESVPLDPPMLAAGLAAAGFYLGGVLAIVDRLRRIFMTLTAGDPFHPDNVARLRLIGAILGGLEVLRYAVWSLSAWLMPAIERRDVTLNLTAWFSVLVIFVLAEVFREGARLRREAELTI